MVTSRFNLSPRGVKIGQPGAPTGSMRSMASLPSPPRRERAVLSEAATKLMQEGLIDAAPLSEDSNLFEDLLGITRKKQDDYIRDANVRAIQITGEQAASRQAVSDDVFGSPIAIQRALNPRGTATSIDGYNVDAASLPSPPMQNQVDIVQDVDREVMQNAINESLDIPMPAPIRERTLPPLDDVTAALDKNYHFADPRNDNRFGNVAKRFKKSLEDQGVQALLAEDPAERLSMMNQLNASLLPQVPIELAQGRSMVIPDVDGGTGTIIATGLAPEVKPSALENKVQSNMKALQLTEDFDNPDDIEMIARAYAGGLIEIVTNEFGVSRLMDKANGRFIRPLTAASVAILQGSDDPPVSGEPPGSETSQSPLPQASIDLANTTGFWGGARHAANIIAGSMLQWQPFPENSKSAAAMASLNARVAPALIGVLPGRDNQNLMDQLVDLTVKPNEWFSGSPEQAEDEYRSLVSTLQKLKNQQDKMIKSGRFSPKLLQGAKITSESIGGLIAEFNAALGPKKFVDPKDFIYDQESTE